MPRKLKVLALYDVPYAPPNGRAPRAFMVGDEWRDERDVLRALTKLGHAAEAFGLFDDVVPLVERLRAGKPDVVFNFCEGFRGARTQEGNIPALLELMGVAYTGAGPEALALCKDKALTKKVLVHHGVRVPAFAVSPRAKPLRELPGTLALPVIVKPLGLDASQGLSHDSLCRTGGEALRRAAFLHAKLGVDALIEAYVDGRELYVPVLGNERLTVWPPTELHFKRLSTRAPRFLTYKAKWDDAYRKKYGIDSDAARRLPPPLAQELAAMARECFRALKLSGYARVDVRLAANGEPYVLEVNPNPSIKRVDDFAWAARRAGVAYEDVIARILRLALARRDEGEAQHAMSA
jgi:D-alanine-D-alanine ligase